MQASKVREHMKVVGSDMQPVGTVDKVEGDRIKLAKNDPEAQDRVTTVMRILIEGAKRLAEDR